MAQFLINKTTSVTTHFFKINDRVQFIYLFNSSYRQQVTQVKQHKDKSNVFIVSVIV